MSEPEKTEEPKKTAIQSAKAWGGEHIISVFYSLLFVYWPISSDISARIPAKTINRESRAPNFACHTGIRTTCPTFPTLADAFPAPSSLLDVPQPTGFQDRQCRHHCCLQRRISSTCRAEETWLREQVWRSRHHKRCDDGVGLGQRRRRRVGLYFREQIKGG
jgi:hypothetical protein